MTQRLTKLQMIQSLAHLAGQYGLPVRKAQKIIHTAVGKTDNRENIAAALAYRQGRDVWEAARDLPRTGTHRRPRRRKGTEPKE